MNLLFSEVYAKDLQWICVFTGERGGLFLLEGWGDKTLVMMAMGM